MIQHRKILISTQACSGAGLCIAESGKCECFDGFTGDACQRRISTCGVGGKCSGHGQCLPMHHLAREGSLAFVRGHVVVRRRPHGTRAHGRVGLEHDDGLRLRLVVARRLRAGRVPTRGILRRGLLQEAVPDWLPERWKSNFGRPTPIDVILRSCVCSMAPSNRGVPGHRRDAVSTAIASTPWKKPNSLISTQAWPAGSGTRTRTTRGTTRRRRRSDHRDQRRTR